MGSLVLNEYQLLDSEIKEKKVKCRCIFYDENGKLLITNNGGVYLLPGGKVDGNETIIEAIIRELKEELGMDIKSTDMLLLFKLNHYQKDYPQINGIKTNRLISTFYFMSLVPPVIDYSKTELTEIEKSSKFKLDFVDMRELDEILASNNTDNPRIAFYNQELALVLNYLRHYDEPDFSKKMVPNQ